MRGSVWREDTTSGVNAKELGGKGTYFYYNFKLQGQRANPAVGRLQGGGEEKHTQEGTIFLSRQ